MLENCEELIYSTEGDFETWKRIIVSCFVLGVYTFQEFLNRSIMYEYLIQGVAHKYFSLYLWFCGCMLSVDLV